MTGQSSRGEEKSYPQGGSDLHTWVQELFNEFNRTYFGGRLLRYRVKIVNRIPGTRRISGYVHGLCDPRRKILFIQEGGDDIDATLLHEMAHAAVAPYMGHGVKWLTEMKRLQAARAPINEGDVNFEPLPRVTQKLIRQETREVISAAPRTTVRKFLRWLHNERGFGESRAALLRQYPWIPHLFQKVKKEIQAEVVQMEAFKRELQAKKQENTHAQK